MVCEVQGVTIYTSLCFWFYTKKGEAYAWVMTGMLLDPDT